MGALLCTVPLMLPWGENFDIGADTGTPVDDPGLPGAVRLQRTIDKPTFAPEPPKLKRPVAQ